MQIYNELPSIIVDVGTETTKIGYAAQETPLIYKYSSTKSNNYTSPLNHGKILNIIDFCVHITDSLMDFDKNLYSENQPQDYYSLIICMNNINENNTKIYEKLTSHIFSNINGFRCPFNSIFFVNNLVCDLFSYGKINGVVVNLSSTISVGGILDGLIFKSLDFNFGSNDITYEFYEMFKKEIQDVLKIYTNDKSEEYKKMKELELARDIKDTILTFNPNSDPIKYDLPFGLSLVVDQKEMEKITDKILTNTIKLIKEILENSDTDKKNILMNNIVLSGGMSNIPGICDKLTEELIKIYPPSKLKVTHEKNMFNTFFGASILGSLGSMKGFFITRADYDQSGCNVISKRLFKWTVK